MEATIQMVEVTYLQGNYRSCEQICNVLMERSRNSKLNISDFGLDEREFSYVLENNILVLKSLTWIRDNDSYESWNGIMQNFIQLNHDYTNLRELNSIPLKYYLNAVHNTLWWGWWHPHGFHTDRLNFETCIQVACDCFRKVLKFCGSEYLSSSFCDSSDAIVDLMKQVAGNLSTDTVLLLLVDIFVLSMLMLLELEPRREICMKCIATAHTVLNAGRKLTFRDEKQCKWNLKLGLTQVNTSDPQVSLKLLEICYCVFLIKTDQHAECIEYLAADKQLSCVENYLKVFACYISGDLLVVPTMEAKGASSRIRVKCHHLSGRVLSEAGRHNDALVVLFRALREESKELLDVIHYCIAKEYETLYKACPPGALSSCVQMSHVDTLHHLVEVLKNNESNRNPCFCVESRILNIVDHQPAVSLSEALCLLGLALAKSGDVRAACDVYVEMLALSDVLPTASVTLHDAAALHVMCNKLEEAESLCRRAVSCYMPQNHGLLSFEDDIVALMLLAHISKLRTQYAHQADTLDRCLRIVKQQKHLSEMSHVVNFLSAKLHAEKANNYLRRSPSYRRDAIYELKHAILCNPDDEDILKSYKQLVHGMLDTRNEASTAHRLPLRDCSEIAVNLLFS